MSGTWGSPRGAQGDETGSGRGLATETLTRVLIEHFGFPNRGGLLDCVCGALRDRTVSEHSAHQAAAVIEALELREEWAHMGKSHPDDDEEELDEWSCGHPIISPTRYGVVHDSFDRPVRRWVSSWTSGSDQ